MELHVWNRAFGLPSLDPECLAAIAFLSIAVPPDLWVLVESSNPSLSPNGALPALKDDARWIAGFESIVAHVNTKTAGRSDIDGGLTGPQRAQAVAYRSFIRKTGRPIVALSLYMTPKNWVNATRPLYSTFVRFPMQYSVPQAQHDRAAELTAHLSSLLGEIDAVAATSAEPSKAEPVSTSVAGLAAVNEKRKGADGDATAEKITTRVKLRNLLAELLDPVRDKLRAGAGAGGRQRQSGSQSYILGTSAPTTVDCLLVGYLSLLALPELPSSWAKEIIEHEFADVARYTATLRPSMFPDDIRYKLADGADELAVAGWLRGGVENVPRLLGWDGGIPLDYDGEATRSSSVAWLALRGLLGIAAAAVGVVAYGAVVGRTAVDVEVQDGIGAPVYAVTSAGSARTGDGEEADEGSDERLPIFRAEDMLGLRL